MIILGSNLNRLDAFTPESMNLTIEERKSVATITLGPNHPNIELGAWLLDDTEPGGGMIWRVKTVDTQYNTNTRTVSLEHIINTLKDTSIFGEVKPADITGNPRATECTAREAFAYCLARQSTWVLGAFEVSATNAYSFNGDSIFSALETITGTLDRAYWDFDLTRLPFRLNVRQFSSAVSCEMRTDRNIQTLKRTVDRSRMYTRFFPIGKNNLHIAGDCVTRNVSLYGAIDRVETDQSKETEAELRAWANERLSRHAEPSVSVQITGLELSQATGEPLDHLTINTQCRVPLPEFGTTITEKITKLTWSDKIREPEKVTITLANLLEDVASISNSAASSASKAGRAGAKKAEEDHAWFVDTTDHVGMVAEAIIGDQEGDIDWSRVSEVMVDGGGIYMSVKRTDGRVTTAETRIDQNEDAIRMEAKRATDAEGALSGRLTVAADRITAEVERATTAEGNLSGRIVVEADRITQEVSRATSAESGLSGRITVEAGRITQEVTDRKSADSSLDSKITVEAGRITQEVTDRKSADSSLDSKITVEAGRITQEVTDRKSADSSLDSKITVEAGRITQEVTDRKSADSSLDSKITVEAGRITQEVTDRQNADTALGSRITQEADRISLVVEGTGENAKIKPASIVSAINAQTGQSAVKISADMIVLDGEAVAQSLTSESLTVETIDAQSGQSVFSDIYVANSDSGGTGWYSTDVCIGASVDNGILTLEFADGSTVDFPKATSLSGAWSSNTYTVTASPQGTTLSTSIGTRFGANNGAYYVESYRSADSGAPGISGASITYKLANNAGTIEIQDANGTRIADTPTISASSGTTLSGAWSSNTYTVTASPQGDTLSTSVNSRFGVDQGVYYIEAYRSSDSGTPGISGASVTYQMANNSGTVELQNTSGTRISDTPTLALNVEEKSITVNGTYTPSGSNIGFSKVVVDVPQTVTGGDKARFNSANGAYFIEAYDNASGTSVAGSSLNYLLTAEYVSGSGVLVQIQDSGGTKLANTRECPIWLLSSNSGVNNQGTLAYDTYYGISSGSTILATWKTPAAPSHNPGVSVQTKYTGSISGRTSKGSAKASELANTYILIDATCGGVTNKYYLTINP